MPRTGTGRVYQRGGVWWIDYSHRGKRHRESSESTKRADATKLLKTRLAEMGGGKFIGPSAEKVTFEDLAELIVADYTVNERKSMRSVHTALKRLREVFGNDRALDITTVRIKTYIAMRRETGLENATIQKDLAALRRMFNLALEDGKVSTRPHVPNLETSNPRQGFFEAADLDAVIKELPEPIRPVVRFAALTGWRRGEVLPLQWAQVDFNAGEVRLWDSKNGEPRVFPFRVLAPLQALLEEQRECTRKLERERRALIPHVFHRNGHPILEIKQAWQGATKRAGLEGWLFHDLRRTAVRNLERAGVPRSVAMKLTGHKTEAVYRRYAIADAAALAEGVEKLARLHATPATERTVVPIAEGRTP